VQKRTPTPEFRFNLLTKIEQLRLAPNSEIHRQFQNRGDLIPLGDGGGLGQHQSTLTAPRR
jgi:hypothetical protein